MRVHRNSTIIWGAVIFSIIIALTIIAYAIWWPNSSKTGKGIRFVRSKQSNVNVHSKQSKHIVSERSEKDNCRCPKGRETFNEANGLNHRGAYYAAFGKYREALNYFKDCESCDEDIVKASWGFARAKIKHSSRIKKRPPSDVLEYLDYALDISRSNEYEELEAQVMLDIAYYYFMHAEFDEAIDWVVEAVSIARNAENKKIEALCFLLKGDILSFQKFPAAVDAYRMTYEIGEEIEDAGLQAKAERGTAAYWRHVRNVRQ